MGTFPGSLSEGAGSPKGWLRECRSLVVPGQWVTHPLIYTLKFLSAYVHRSTLPQSRIRSTAPSEREPGGVRTVQRAGRKPQDCGRFSSPLRNSEVGTFHHSMGDTPSVSFADSSLREGAGNGCVPFNVPLGNRNVAGDFHRPYGTQNVLHSTIQPSAKNLPYRNHLKA